MVFMKFICFFILAIKMSSRRGGHQKWDAKKMTMKKLIYYDNDLASRFDDDEDGQVFFTDSF